MPYVEKVGVEGVKDQIDQWYHVMHDPNLDGYTCRACKRKITAVLEKAKQALVDAPEYVED